MGKYDIGKRVRDEDGDEGVIVDKRKGAREVRYDEPLGFVLWRPKDALTAIPLRLEYGKSYVDREDEVHGPVIRNEDGEWRDTHPFTSEGGSRTWRADGSFSETVGADSFMDLVAKVGDLVNWTRVRGEFDGSTIIDADVALFDCKLMAATGTITYANFNELEPAPLAPMAKPEPRFKVGDRVRLIANPSRNHTVKPGHLATVGDRGAHDGFSADQKWLDIVWDEPRSGQSNGSYNALDFEPAKFKAGDVLRCVDDEGVDRLTRGAIYIAGDRTNDDYVRLVGHLSGYWHSRFELVALPAINSIVTGRVAGMNSNLVTVEFGSGVFAYSTSIPTTALAA